MVTFEWYSLPHYLQQEEAFESKSKMRRPLPGLPDVLAASTNKDEDKGRDHEQPQQGPQTIYRVVGGRKHVQKSEASMQTEPSSIKHPVEQHYDWKKAMAHNARVLSSQEKAMDEYLRRQRAAAEQELRPLPRRAAAQQLLRRSQGQHRHGQPLGYEQQPPGLPA